MKNIIIMLFSLALIACGGGGGGSTPSNVTTTDNNVAYTLFDMNVVKPGVNKTFKITGSDTTGATYTGTVSVVDRGVTVFSSKSVRQTDFIVSLTENNGAFITTTGSVYGDTSTRAVLFSVDDAGVICTATKSAAIPNTAKPGEFGSLSFLACSDGTTESGSWRLEASTNSLAKIIYSFNNLDQSNNSAGNEEDTFTIDVNGNVKSVLLKFTTSSGVVLTLSGS